MVDRKGDLLASSASDGVMERFHAMLERGSRELYDDNRDKMGRGELLETPNVIAPADVELFCSRVLDEVEPLTAYKSYWGKLEQFYEWLCWHTDHPHRYNPVLMAANEHERAGEIWQAKIEEIEG